MIYVLIGFPLLTSMGCLAYIRGEFKKPWMIMAPGTVLVWAAVLIGELL